MPCTPSAPSESAAMAVVRPRGALTSAVLDGSFQLRRFGQLRAVPATCCSRVRGPVQWPVRCCRPRHAVRAVLTGYCDGCRVALPTHKHKFTVLKSPHVYKKHRAQVDRGRLRVPLTVTDIAQWAMRPENAQAANAGQGIPRHVVVVGVLIRSMA